MSKGSARPERFGWLAWVSLALVVALIPPDLLLTRLEDSTSLPNEAVSAVVLLAFATVGALIAARRPSNPIGWIFCGVALLMALESAAFSYAIYGLLIRPGALPGAIWVGLLAPWIRSIAWFTLFTFLPLLFPDGRLPSRHWRVLVWLFAVLLIVNSAGTLLAPRLFDDHLAAIRNPIGLLSADLSDPLQTPLPLLLNIAACTAVIVRFRRARGVEREQLKWFAYAAILAIAWSVFIATAVFVLPTWLLDLTTPLWNLPILGLAVATAIAILRHRLYDIDLIINRTLVYGALTLLLAAVYFGCVVGLQALAQALTGQRGQNPLAIVISTLLIAALFTPLRRRLQAFIDRRFYRRKYDAARTLATFSAALRSEVDLAELSAHLVGVVGDTMQPAHVSLWLNIPDEPRATPH